MIPELAHILNMYFIGASERKEVGCARTKERLDKAAM